MVMNKEYYRGLPRLSYLIRWLEELVGILSRPFLMIGFVLAMFDLLTRGEMLSSGWVFYGWALVQAVAVDASFFVTWARVKTAWKNRNVPVFIGQFVLGVGLGFIAWAAMDIQSLQQALNLTNIQALHELGLDITLLTHIRSAVAIGLAAVVAMRGHTEEDIEPNDRPRGTRFTLPDWTPKWLRKRLPNTPEPLANPTTELDITNEPDRTKQPVFTEPVPNLYLVKTEPDKREQIKQVLLVNPRANLQEIMDKTGASKGYASEKRKELLKEIYDTEEVKELV